MLNFLNYSRIYTLFICICAFTYDIDATAPMYKVVDLGLQESDRSEAIAVNDNGQVVGSYWMFGNKYYFKWTEEDGIRLLDLPETAVIRVLNNAGQITGNYKDSTNKDRGFIWDVSSGFRDLGTLGGGWTRVYDMNNLGQVVGESESENISFVDGAREQHAFIWQNDSMQDLGALSGDLGFLGDRSVATSINDHGQIIGLSNYPIAHKAKLQRSNERVVLWQNGVIEEIKNSVEPQYSTFSAFSINNQGLATYEDNRLGDFIVDVFTNNSTLISFPMHAPAEINDKGDIFLFHRHNYVFEKKAASWVISNGVIYSVIDFFNFYIRSSNSKQWLQNSLDGAYGFNNNNWIVGVAENIYGEKHAVLLLPIEQPELEPSEIPPKIDDEKNDLEDLKELQKILNKYVNNPEALTPFHWAIKIGDVRAVELMLNYGVDIDLQDGGYTPLHRAIEANQMETLALLVRYGAKVNAYDEEGYTPLHRAIVANQFEIVNFLIDHGADIQAIFRVGQAEFRCIDLARQSGNSDLSLLFIDKGILVLEEKFRLHLIEANLKKIDPIELAFQKFDLELVEYLFQTRERALVLKKPTFEFPGYEFTRSFSQGNYFVWTKPTPVKIKGGNGVYVDMLNRVDIDAIKILMKYDSKNIWQKYLVDWLSCSYHLGDLESIEFLYPLAKNVKINVVFHQREQRYLVDPFLSNFPIDREDPSHFYIPGLGRNIPPSLFEYRSDDNALIRKFKRQIQDYLL